MQGLGERLGAVVLHGAKEWTFQVLGVPGVLQIRGDEPLRQLMRAPDSAPYPPSLPRGLRHPFPLVDVAHFERTQLLAAQP